MTKREICERLIKILNRIFYEYAMADRIEDLDVEAIGKDIGALIRDLAAPEEEKHPGVIVPVNKKYPATCLKCGGEAEIVDNMFGTSDDWAYCPKCVCAYRIKRGKDEK